MNQLPKWKPKVKLKLAVVVTHPIQYQVPVWKKLTEMDELSIKVFYASKHGVEESHDPLYGKSFAWDVPLLEGYNYEFLDSMKIPFLPAPLANLFPIKLFNKLKQDKFDAILIHGYMNGSALAGYFFGLMLRNTHYYTW